MGNCISCIKDGKTGECRDIKDKTAREKIDNLEKTVNDLAGIDGGHLATDEDIERINDRINSLEADVNGLTGSDGGHLATDEDIEILENKINTLDENVKIIDNKHKNLFNRYNYKIKNNEVHFTCPLEIGKSYTVSSNKEIRWLKISNASGGYGSVELRTFTKGTFVMTRNANIPSYETEQYIFIGLPNTTTLVSDIDQISDYNIQIEEGSEATDYIENKGNIIYQKDMYNTVLDGKLDKVTSDTTYSQVYVKSANGSQQLIDLTSDWAGNKVPMYDNSGNLSVNFPSSNYSATPKYYVDDADKTNADAIESLGIRVSELEANGGSGGSGGSGDASIKSIAFSTIGEMHTWLSTNYNRVIYLEESLANNYVQGPKRYTYTIVDGAISCEITTDDITLQKSTIKYYYKPLRTVQGSSSIAYMFEYSCFYDNSAIYDTLGIRVEFNPGNIKKQIALPPANPKTTGFTMFDPITNTYSSYDFDTSGIQFVFYYI